jgi:hypothetical protein
MEWSDMLSELLARERARSYLTEAQRLRHSRRLRALRRAKRHASRAERRMVEASRRAAALRGALEIADY